MTSPSGGSQYQQDVGAPGGPHGPKITSIFDFSAESLEQIAFWLEQRGLHIPVAQIIGYQQGRPIRSSAVTDVANTVTLTNVLSEKIAGGLLGTTGSLRVTLGGDLLYNNNVADTVTLQVAFGGTTLWQTPLSSALSATRRAWVMEFIINNASASSQFMFGKFFLSTPNAATAGIGTLTAAATFANPFSTAGSVSVDTTQPQTLTVSAQWSAASSNNSFRCEYYILEPIF